MGGFFQTTPEYIDKYGVQVGRAAEYARDAKEYIERSAEISSGEQGWLGLLGDAHRMITEAIGKELDGLAEAGTGGGNALRRAAGYYTHTDNASAQKLDATYENKYYGRDQYMSDHYRDGEWVK